MPAATRDPEGFDSATAAEQAFYAAFAAADVDAMMVIWAGAPYIVCVHPLGPPLLGPRAIRESWRQIFLDGLPRRFRIEGQDTVCGASIAVRTVREFITVPGVLYASQPIIATNVYQRLDRGWLMILHHASPEGVAEPGENEDGPGPSIH